MQQQERSHWLLEDWVSPIPLIGALFTSPKVHNTLDRFGMQLLMYGPMLFGMYFAMKTDNMKQSFDVRFGKSVGLMYASMCLGMGLYNSAKRLVVSCQSKKDEMLLDPTVT